MQGQIVLEKYKIGRLIGRGSMGQVYLAHPCDGGPDVVVKFMNERIASQPRFKELFGHEMEAMSRFRHPHAVRLLGGKLDEPLGPCILMEYIGGIEMAELLQQQHRFESDRLGRLVVPICKALHAAHSAGIIHRDLKPANVKVQNPNEENETAIVMDLGLASMAYKPYIPIDKLQGSAEEHLVGTPVYICPEQVRGDNTDHRGDIYSLGVMMYESLTGRLPFEDQEILALLQAHKERSPPRFSEVGIDDISPKVEELVLMCLAKFPNERPQTAFEVAERYRAALGIHEPLNDADFAPQVAATVGGIPAENDGNRIVQSFAAWMPESIAIIKLRGFMEDIGARVLESSPGLIRVQLGELQKTGSKGLLGWFRKPKTDPLEDEPRESDPIVIDLNLSKQPGAANRVDITTIYRAVKGPLPDDPRWHDRVNQLSRQLQGYLMVQH